MADDQFFIISHGDSSGTDEDFVLVTDDDGFPTDDSDEDDSDEDDSDASVRGDEIENRQGPIAPKRTLSAFMFFAQAERENTKKENPGISFFDLGKVLGEKWRSMSAEEKEPYEEKARADAARYMAQRADYKNLGSVDLDSENETDSE